jgi:DNA-binding NarL/FixJ family response regulator
MSEWNDICSGFCQDRKLSNRQAEVFCYLARGRNAAAIAKVLFISESTVKTHIAHIYRRLGIHTQQELIDAIDDWMF